MGRVLSLETVLVFHRRSLRVSSCRVVLAVCVQFMVLAALSLKVRRPIVPGSMQERCVFENMCSGILRRVFCEYSLFGVLFASASLFSV
jgi:hypothetical protein